MLRVGSVGPVVPVGMAMAPRVARAVPHGRAACRGTVIVSSETDYNTARGRSEPKLSGRIDPVAQAGDP